MTSPSAPPRPQSTHNHDVVGDDHIGTSVDTPLRQDAFALSDQAKIEAIESKFRDIMNILGLDLTDDSLAGTPHRVAKMYVQEIFRGLNPANHPDVKTFGNNYGYHHMLVERNITLNSTCEHHFLPIVGVAHVAYIPGERVVGLSKLNRIVDHYAKRPQVQERLTRQIAESLRALLGTDDIAVMIDAKHLCVSSRGIQDEGSSTVTSFLGGAFEHDESMQHQFYAQIQGIH